MDGDRPGTILAGKYQLIRIAGQGGMAQVWRARIVGETGPRFVAVKRMLVDPDRAEQFAALFKEEARVGLQLRHPNIVGVMDFVATRQDGYFLVMDWVEGLDLLDYMRAFHSDQRHVPWQAIAAIGRGVASGLAGAHERKGPDGSRQPVIHRDVTPGNILLGIDGTVKITDFGLARAMDRGNMTMPNTIKGKLSYTAPEIAEGQRATERSDLFSLGVTLWEALAGCKLFAGKSNFEVIEAIFRWDVRKLAPIRPDVPAPLVTIVERAIARHPADRFASARLMAAALDNVLRSDPVNPARLGNSVTAARDRLAELDGTAGEEPSVVEEVAPPPRAAAAERAPVVVPPPPPAPAVAAPVRPPPVPPTPPEIRMAREPQESLELSFSDLFATETQGVADPKSSPASARIGVPRTRSEAVLDHPSSWNLDVADLDADKGEDQGEDKG